ncbi:MAG: TetR/AcrR family transcriptional regulator [Actinobacteria bacterium]|nr:TetR/AcrR family transcriptional regulator [Actinomycetota bacterium]
MGVKDRKKREKEQRRHQILDAARDLFMHKGYFDVRMDDIATGAEVAIGTLYLYFHNKDEIYATLCEEGLDILNRLIEDAIREEGSFQECLEAIGRSYLGFYMEYGSYYDVLSFVGMGFKQVGLSEELEKKITQKSDAAISKLEFVVKQGMEAGEIAEGDSKEVAFFLWGLLEGLIFIHRRGYMDAWAVDLARTSAVGMEAIYRGISR